MKMQPISAERATDEAFWEGVRAAYPQQRPLMNLNNAAVSSDRTTGYM